MRDNKILYIMYTRHIISNSIFANKIWEYIHSFLYFLTCFIDFLYRDCMCKSNVEIKDSCEVNQSQNAERRNLRYFFLKNKMITKSTHGCLTFLQINTRVLWGLLIAYRRKILIFWGKMRAILKICIPQIYYLITNICSPRYKLLWCKYLQLNTVIFKSSYIINLHYFKYDTIKLIPTFNYKHLIIFCLIKWNILSGL